MANLKEIRARIDSTKNSQQITKALKLVSAAKLRKAQHNVVNMRPYAFGMKRVIADIAFTQKVSHPLMELRLEPKNILLVVLTSDRGLCGAFNTNISKFAEQYWKEHKARADRFDFFFIGRRGHDYFAKRGVQGIEYINQLDKEVSYTLAAKVADQLLKTYLSGQYDEIRLVYNEFKSAISQTVVCETLLPIDLSVNSFPADAAGEVVSADMVFEPSPETIIEQLLVKNFDLQVYRCMSESVASEHGARMSAMENASTNAKTMIESLTLSYNKLRQEKITRELIEIVSGAEALA